MNGMVIFMEELDCVFFLGTSKKHFYLYIPLLTWKNKTKKYHTYLEHKRIFLGHGLKGRNSTTVSMVTIFNMLPLNLKTRGQFCKSSVGLRINILSY